MVIARHDVLPRDGDVAPGHEHRVLVHRLGARAEPQAALEMAERVVAVALACATRAGDAAAHERTDTAIDGETGWRGRR